MGLYNFHARFVPFILDGSKTHTIRADRNHPDSPGKICHLFTGLRTTRARLLMRRPCVRIERIRIDSRFRISIDGRRLPYREAAAFAYRDGFRERGPAGALDLMREFWRGRLPFSGNVIHWQDPAKG